MESLLLSLVIKSIYEAYDNDFLLTISSPQLALALEKDKLVYNGRISSHGSECHGLYWIIYCFDNRFSNGKSPSYR